MGKMLYSKQIDKEEFIMNMEAANSSLSSKQKSFVFKVPILKDIGGPAILSIFIPSILVFYQLLNVDFMKAIAAFMKGSNFLYFYIACLITGSILGMLRVVLIQGFIRMFIPILVGSIGSIVAGTGAGMLAGHEEEIRKVRQAGILESNDVTITVAPGEAGSGVFIDLTSIMKDQYGDAIRRTLLDVAVEQGSRDIYITVADRGALECTIRARLLTALTRAGAVRKKGGV
jgi:citrate lyase subunit gamma (acyl carrier protein)